VHGRAGYATLSFVPGDELTIRPASMPPAWEAPRPVPVPREGDTVEIELLVAAGAGPGLRAGRVPASRPR
jgi:hypothetical protein